MQDLSVNVAILVLSIVVCSGLAAFLLNALVIYVFGASVALTILAFSMLPVDPVRLTAVASGGFLLSVFAAITMVHHFFQRRALD